jgi:hypothetical protein
MLVVVRPAGDDAAITTASPGSARPWAWSPWSISAIMPEDLNAHGRAPHMKVWREYSAPLKVSPTVIEIISDGKVERL